MVNKKPETTDIVKPEEQNFSFEISAEKAVDEMFKNKQDAEKPESHHITEKIRTGMEIKHNLPDKGYLGVKVDKGKVTFTDRYGEKQIKDKIIITSKDIEDVEHVEITDGVFAMDFRNDCDFWCNRSPVTVPAMIKQAVHTHLDIKKCYEMEKRRAELPIVLIAALLGGVIIIVLMLFSLMG